jgi:hypothetical protein
VKTVECHREDEVLEALTSGRWSERDEDDLRRHTSACEICSDLVVAVEAMLADREGASNGARIPSSAVMWWRAQMRARQEAAREASRPITVAQVIGSVITIVLAIALLNALSPWLLTWLHEARATVAGSVPQFEAPQMLAHGWLLPALIVGMWLVLAPLAIYFAVADD